MRTQLQGIALILFGILLELVAMIDPWVPVIDVPSLILLPGGIVLGAVGLFFCFKGRGDD